MFENNTTKPRTVFSPEIVYAVWQKATMLLPGYSPDEWRKDSYGKFIRYQDYGNTHSEFGWEIDHVFPVSLGGTDALSNLQPLQWQNNRRKSASLV